MMTTASEGIRELRKAAKAAGATLERDSSGKYCVWQICAPPRHQWGGCGAHYLRVEWLRGDEAWRDDAIADAIQRLADESIVTCDCGDCA
jgi:hypothetical protein